MFDKYRKEETTDLNSIVYYESIISRFDMLLHGSQTIEVITKRQVLYKQLSTLLL